MAYTEEDRVTETIEEEEAMLMSKEEYLSHGVHIGTRIATADMRPFIYRVRSDGLFVLDVRAADTRIKIAARFIARYPPENVVVFSARQYGQAPVKKFAEVTGCIAYPGRFIPGSLMNPSLTSTYIEPELIILTDPRADKQPLSEANQVGIPVIALLDTDSTMRGVDLAIPCNNKGRRSLAAVYWLVARQILRERGTIPPDGEISLTISDFKMKTAPF
jgi:small subunit ribosomal protein S2